MIFKNREEAGKLLAEKLKKYVKQNPIVLGIPRGAIPMALNVARTLDATLGAVLVHKIGAPDNEEFAVGCVGISGHVHLLPHASAYGVSQSYIQAAAKEEMSTLKKRQKDYGLDDLNLRGKTAIIVDDGIATGATTICAIHEVKALNPEKIVLACAVSSPRTAREISSLVDELVLLAQPDMFFSVGQFFKDFSQVTDEQVIQIFADEKRREKARRGAA